MPALPSTGREPPLPGGCPGPFYARPGTGRHPTLGGVVGIRVPAFVLPQHFALAIGAGQHPGQDEQQVGQPVEVADRFRPHGVVAGQGDRLALGPAHDGAGQVATRGGLASRRQDEVLQRRQIVVVMVQLPLQRLDIVAGDGGMARDAQLAAQVEQLVLHGGQQGADVVRHTGHGQQHADGRIGFVHRAVGGHARGVLAHARAVAQPGAAVVAGAGVDLREAVAHRGEGPVSRPCGRAAWPGGRPGRP